MSGGGEPHAPKKTSKARSGCSQCRRTRVKCDECRPKCTRCARLFYICEYPLRVLSRRDCPRPDLRPLARAETASAIRSQPPLGRLSEVERPYFEHFQLVVAPELASQPYGISDFWHRTVLRDALADRLVLDIIVAIGALSRALESRNRGRCAVGSRHYALALGLYGRALTRYRDFLAGQIASLVSPRKVVIMTLLMTIFEFLQGNRTGVDGITAKALMVLKDVLMRGRRPLSVERTDGNTTAHTKNIASKVVQALDDQGAIDAEFYLARWGAYMAMLTPMYPQSRRSVMQFRQYMEAPRPPSIRETLRDFDEIYKRFLIVNLLWIHQIVELVSSGELLATDPTLQLEQRAVAARCSEWLDAVRQRRQEWCSTHDSKLPDDLASDSDWLYLQLLNIGTKTTFVSVITVLDTSRGIMERHPYTSDIISGTKAVLRALPPPEDDGTSSCQHFHKIIYERLAFSTVNLSRECRDAGVRAEMTALSREIARRSMTRDMRAALLGGIAHASVEDRYRDEAGFLPEEMHHDWTAVRYENGPDGKCAVMHATFAARAPVHGLTRKTELAIRLGELYR